jgi:predicted PurR-regulated permease PerM
MSLRPSNNVPAAQTTRWALTAVLIVVGLLALWAINGILLLALTSVVLVVFFTTPIRFLTRRGFRRTLAAIISLLLLPLILLILTMTILPLLSAQFTTLADLVQQGIDQIIVSWENLDAQPPKYFLGWGDAVIQPPRDPVSTGLLLLRESFQLDASLIQQVFSQVVSAFSQIGVTVLPVVSGVASTLLNFLIVVFMSIYLLADPKGHEDAVIRLLPISYRPRGREILVRLDLAMRGWLESTLLAMIFVAVATWFSLTLLGLREALALGVVAGLLAFVPTFGTLVAAVLAVAVAILQQPQNVLWVILVTYGISLIQSQVISPLLIAGRINLPPIMVLLSQIIFGVFFGFMGLLLAVPLAAILMVLVQEIYIKDILGDYAIDVQSDVVTKEAQAIAIDDGLMTDGV